VGGGELEQSPGLVGSRYRGIWAGWREFCYDLPRPMTGVQVYNDKCRWTERPRGV